MSSEIEFVIEKNFSISKLSDLATDIGETALDACLNGGLLKDIPIINTVVNIAKLSMNIRDLIYVKKILRFLYHFEDVNENERNKLIAKFNNDSELNRKFGEYLVTLLENIDQVDKSEFVAKCFKAYLLDKINYTELLRLNHGISQLLLANLNDLTNFYEIPGYFINESALQNLGNSGFVLIASAYGGSLGPEPSEIGEKFLINVFGKNIVLKAKKNRERDEAQRNEERQNKQF